MTHLPTELPQWYQLQDNEERGWTPKTEDIIYSAHQPKNNIIREAWYAKNQTAYTPPTPKKPTLNLQILTPIQVGGGSLPEGMILPAQIGGYPCIPGSTVRGALLAWIRAQWQELPTDEKEFWSSLMQCDHAGWNPRAIRFESVPLKTLRPYPLNAQQSWQVFYDKNPKGSNRLPAALSLQWQAAPKEPPGPGPEKIPFQVILHHKPSQQQQTWLQNRLTETLQQQGIGRGKASGFGRLTERLPQKSQWEILLTGMKPGIQTHSPQDNILGQYRWSPQVLRANLRGWFTRIALSQMTEPNALQLTAKIFGGLESVARLNLTSYRLAAERTITPKNSQTNTPGYANIPRKDAEETWKIGVQCNDEFKPLIGALLELAQRLGGLGPGWRRPPHDFKHKAKKDKIVTIYRGSQFTTETEDKGRDLNDLIAHLQTQMRDLAQTHNLAINPPRVLPSGCIHSIWRSDNPDQWREIVHGVCATHNPDRPVWCGTSSTRPSGYAAREYDDHCLITVFEEAIATTIGQHEFQQIGLAGVSPYQHAGSLLL